MGETDQGIKRLLQAFPADILHFALGPECEYLGMLDTDVAIEAQLVMDRLFHALYQGDECAIDMEVQGKSDASMPQRMFRYAQRGSFIYKMKLLSLVLWLRKGKDTFTRYVYEERVGDRLLGTWVIYGIEIFALQARDILNGNVLALLPLVPFMQGGDMSTIEEAAHRVEREMPDELGKTLNTLLAVFTAQFHGKSAARALLEGLKMNTSIVEESPLYQEWVEQAEAKGKAEGKAEGTRNALISVLSGRFGSLDADLTVAIERADEAALLAVLQHITTDTLDEIRQRLS